MLIKLDSDNNITYNGLNWDYQVKGILDSLGLSHIWIHQFEMDIPFSLIKQRIFDMYKQTWYATINNSNRLLLYACYKHDFNFETYLNFTSENKYRIALTKFRLSSHDLAIERGRYQNIERSERIFRHCNGNFVENEYHFLLVCPFYRDLRRKYLKPYYCHWPTLNKFDDLMAKTNKKVILNFAKFIYLAFRLRNDN